MTSKHLFCHSRAGGNPSSKKDWIPDRVGDDTKMKKFGSIGIIGFIFYLGIVLYANRGVYTSRFDPAYWKDRYEHSQWKLPQSQRGIGDEGLYLHEGYVLVNGADPTLYNAEVPPLGKYAIGASILLFGNGYLFGILATTAALVAFFFLAKSVLPKSLALATTLLVAMDPLVTSQFAATMLESLQLLFFLVTCLLVLSLLKQKSVLKIPAFILAIGAGFGAFSAVKFPLLSPVIGFCILAIIWQKTKRVAPILLFLAVSFIIYLIPYLRYFLLGHTITNWLGVQKWVINFYLHANLLPNFGSFFTALTTGWIQNFFTRGWERAAEWSPVWPFIFIAALMWCLQNRKKYRVLISTFLLAMGLYSVIPFWTRYLVLFLPILYLVTIAAVASCAKKLLPFVVVLIVAVNGISSFRILFPTPQGMVNQFVYDWQHGFFQDMYEQLSNESQNNISRQAFHRVGLQTFSDAQIEKVKIISDPVIWSRFRTPQTIQFNITYTTRNLGSFTEATTLPIIKEKNRWRIPWNWNLLMNGFTDSAKLETKLQHANRGSILASDGAILAQDIPSFFVSVIPEKIDSKQEEIMLKFLETEFGERVAAIGLYRRYMQNSLPDQPVPLGVLMRSPDDKTYKKLLSYPGIQLTPWFGRMKKSDPASITIGTIGNTQFFECCSLLYNTTAYNGISGLEKEYNDILKGENGGTLVLKDATGSVIRTLIHKEKRDGKTVRL